MSDVDPSAPRTVVPIESSLLAGTFGHDQVTDLRHTVTAIAGSSGLRGQRLDDFVLAVNELLTNAVRHGGGYGHLRLWRDADTMCCEVSDSGEGIGRDRLVDGKRPAPHTVGGWGLWLARQLSDQIMVRTGPEGTTVRISAAAEPVPPAGAGEGVPAGGTSPGPASNGGPRPGR